MGLIYADGDGIGRELERLHTLEEIRQFARAVDGAAYQAVVEAVAGHLPPAQLAKDSILPFDVLLLGGDDGVLVTVADRALEVALTLVESFSQETERRIGRSLRLSATVILAHARYPFAALVKLAESGLAFAKREAAARRRRGEQPREGLINFLVVSSTNHLDLNTYVERVLRPRPPLSQEALDRTLRPYTTTDFRRLLQAARVLADGPRTRVQQLREACFLDHMHGQLEALSALLRWPESYAKREPLRLVADFAHSAGGREVQFPWFLDRAEQVWRTPIADVAEIFDFIAPEVSHAATP